MADFVFKCPQCGADYKAEENVLGKTVKCQVCGKDFIVTKEGTICPRKEQKANAVQTRNFAVSANRFTAVTSKNAKELDTEWKRLCYGPMAADVFAWRTIWYSGLRGWVLYSIRCPKCGMEDVKCAPQLQALKESKAVFSCQRCKSFFSLHDGCQCHEEYYTNVTSYAKSKVVDIDRQLNAIHRQIEAINVRDRFIEEEELFEAEWEIYQNPVIQERLEFTIEKLRARLSTLNTEKIVNAQRSVEASNVAYGTTIGLSGNSIEGMIGALIRIGGAAEYSSAQREGQDIYGSASDIQRKIERHEAMMEHYYDLKAEFHGCQKEAAREKRLVARCKYANRKDLPPLDENLPDQEVGLGDLKDALYNERDMLEILSEQKDKMLKKATQDIESRTVFIMVYSVISFAVSFTVSFAVAICS